MSRIQKTMEAGLQIVASRPFKVIFWDGSERNFGSGEPKFVIRIKSAYGRRLGDPFPNSMLKNISGSVEGRQEHMGLIPSCALGGCPRIGSSRGRAKMLWARRQIQNRRRRSSNYVEEVLGLPTKHTAFAAGRSRAYSRIAS